MYVKLIEPDEGVNLVNQMAYYARVSNPENQHNNDTSERLIDYCMRKLHWSVFEMATICVEIYCARDIGRQILRHRSMNFQEFSARYSHNQYQPEYREARMQDERNRQNSIDTDDEALKREWIERQNHLSDIAQEQYKWALNNGIAKEVARAVLPEGLTMSRMYMRGSVRSWIHYIDLRTEAGTQREHRDVASACAREVARVFPMIRRFDHTLETTATGDGT